MKKDILRIIAAALFLAGAAFAAKDAFDNLGTIGIFIPKALFVCAIAALAVSVWLNKSIAVKASALTAAAAKLIEFVEPIFSENQSAFFSMFRLDSFYFSSLMVALSLLLLFIAASVKNGSFAVSCFSAGSSIMALVSTFMVRFSVIVDIYEQSYLIGSGFGGPSEQFKSTLEILIKYHWAEVLLYLLMALAILLWGISQRRAKTPALSAVVSSGDAISALEKLDELRQAGAISQEEYESEKAEIMKML